MIPLLAAEAGGHTPPLDALALALVLVAAWGGGALATRVGYPAVLGELIVGIVLGPPMLGLLSDGEGLAAIGELGVVLMMVYIGTEIDLDHLKRASRPGLLAAIGGFVVPFAAGFGVTLLFGYDAVAGVFVGAAVGVTSLATKSRILADLKLFDTRIAYVLVAGALLSDTATLLLFAGVTAYAGESGVGSLATVALEAVAFGAVVLLAGWAAPRFGEWTRRRGLDGPGWGLGVLIAVGLGGAAVAELFGLHSILGAFAAGMVLRRGVLEGRTERRSLDLLGRMSLGVLAPVFFASAGFAISLTAARENIGLVVAVFAVATIGKVVGTALFYLPSGHGWREGLVVGGAMNGRGAVEIVVAGIGLDQGLITTEIFTALVLMAIGTTALVPVAMKIGVEWLRGRGELADADETRRGVTIVGAGAFARALGRVLAEGRDVHLLDTNADRVRLARRQGLHAVLGDGLDPEALRDAYADEASLLYVLTPNVEVNAFVADVAREEVGVREIRVAIGPDAHPTSVSMLERSGARPLVDEPVDVERWGAWIAEGIAMTTTVEITDLPRLAEVEAQLADASDVVPVAVHRGDDIVPYQLLDRLRVDDRLVAFVRDGSTGRGGAGASVAEGTTPLIAEDGVSTYEVRSGADGAQSDE